MSRYTRRRSAARRSYRRRSAARRSYRRRNMKKCPRGTARKIVGQRRRWSGGVDRIVRHGRLTKKCYRKQRGGRGAGGYFGGVGGSRRR